MRSTVHGTRRTNAASNSTPKTISLIAFVPYPNLIALLTEDANLVDERSIM